MPAFEAHNVELSDGSHTIPGQPLLRDTALYRASLHAMQEFAPPGAGAPPTLIDIGCREGGYAIEFARAGYDVVGLEARPSNVERCTLLAADAGLENVRFVCDDARNLLDHGTFDVVFCCGLLYHLDRPVEFLSLLGQVTDRLLVLNTHYSTKLPTPAFALSDLTESEGRLGRWYLDLVPGTSYESMEANRGASWGNSHSFWIEKAHLLQTMREVGFDLVLEQFDFLENILDDSRVWIEEQTRSQFLGVRRTARDHRSLASAAAEDHPSA